MHMKQLILKFFLAGGVMSTALFCSNQEKMRLNQKDSTTNKIFDNQQTYDDYDNHTNPIICDVNDQEVCEYIEQQEESDLKIWLREQGISLFLKLIYLKECLGRCKETLYAWLKKLIVIPY